MARRDEGSAIFFNSKLYARIKRRAEFEGLSITRFANDLMNNALTDYEDENPYDTYSIKYAGQDMHIAIEAANEEEAIKLFLLQYGDKISKEELHSLTVEKSDNILGI